MRSASVSRAPSSPCSSPPSASRPGAICCKASRAGQRGAATKNMARSKHKYAKNGWGVVHGMTNIIGKRIVRIEDPDLIRGKARFVDDIHIDGILHAAFVRSPHAHAKILSVGKDGALAAPGIRAVLTADDIASYVTTDRLAVALPDRTYKQQRDRPILAKLETVYAGEAVAIVIADTPYLAEDAAALVEIDYQPLPAVTDCHAALEPNAACAHADADGNLLAEFSSAYGNVDAAFAAAAYTFKGSIEQHRGCAHSIE